MLSFDNPPAESSMRYIRVLVPHSPHAVGVWGENDDETHK